MYVSRAGKRVKTKIRTYREEISDRYLGQEVNKQDLKREKDAAWEGQHGGIRWQNKRGDLTCLCVLNLPSERSVQFIPPLYSSEAVQTRSSTAAALSARGCRAEPRPSRALPARLPRRPGLDGLRALARGQPGASPANNTRAPLRALISAISGRWQKSGPQALSEERLQTFVRAGCSWASYVHLVKHTKDFPR